MRIVSSWRYVTHAAHAVSSMRPITIERGSTSDRAATSSRSGSFQSACASTKSIPCFALFAVDFSGSKSNGMRYRNYTTWDTGSHPAGSVAPTARHGTIRIESPRVAVRASRAPWSMDSATLPRCPLRTIGQGPRVRPTPLASTLSTPAAGEPASQGHTGWGPFVGPCVIVDWFSLRCRLTISNNRLSVTRTMADDDTKEAIDQLANSLQTIALLSTRLRHQLGESAQEAVDLEAAADRAVRAIRRLQPPPDACSGKSSSRSSAQSLRSR